MKFRVSMAVKSAFTSIALRKSLAPHQDVQVVAEERSCASAEQMLLAHPTAVALVDVELFAEPGSQGLINLLAARREPTVLINARGSAVPENLQIKRSIHLLSGRHPGELDIGHIQEHLLATIHAAREAKVQAGTLSASLSSLGSQTIASATPKPASGILSVASLSNATSATPPRRGPADLIVIGVSTGGPTLLLKMIKGLNKPTIPTLIAQHMPAGETAGFALRLSEECSFPVVEVGPGALPEAGTMGIVQGGRDFQLSVAPHGRLRLREAQVPGNPFHPSIDHLLQTAAEANIATHSVILTGMGQDGSIGALELNKRGYPVIAQRPETCAVAGMPSAAIQNGAAQQVQSPDQIVDSINRWYAAKCIAPSSGSSAPPTRP